MHQAYEGRLLFVNIVLPSFDFVFADKPPPFYNIPNYT